MIADQEAFTHVNEVMVSLLGLGWMAVETRYRPDRGKLVGEGRWTRYDSAGRFVESSDWQTLGVEITVQ